MVQNRHGMCAARKVRLKDPQTHVFVVETPRHRKKWNGMGNIYNILKADLNCSPENVILQS